MAQYLYIGGPLNGKLMNEHPEFTDYTPYILATSSSGGVLLCVHTSLDLHTAAAILIHTYNNLHKNDPPCHESINGGDDNAA